MEDGSETYNLLLKSQNTEMGHMDGYLGNFAMVRLSAQEVHVCQLIFI